MRRRSRPVLAVIVGLYQLTTFGAPAPFEIQQPDFKTYTFENGVPVEFRASEGSVLTITTNLFKTGRASMRWEWRKPGAVLNYRCAEAFQHLTGQNPDPIVYQWVAFVTLSTLDFWIYNEKPLTDELWMEIGEGTNTDCRFSMKLNFSGWRQFRAMYGRDLPAFPSAKADTLRFLAPASGPAGSLCFDLFSPRVEQDVRRVRATEQTSWVFRGASPPSSVTDGHTNAVRHIEIKVPEQLSAEQLATIARLTKVVLSQYQPAESSELIPLSTAEWAVLRRLHCERGFERNQEKISGAVGTIGGNPAYTATAGDRAYWSEMEQFADAWRRTESNPKGRQELESFILDYIDLAIQHGSGAGYATRDSFARPVLWLKELLMRHGRFDQLLAKLRAQNRMEEIYVLQPTADADYYNTLSAGRLFLIFAQDDPKAKYRDLRALKYWLEQTARFGEIRPDGSLFHHKQTYTGYNIPAIGPLVEFNYLLAGTEFYAPTSHKMARRVAYAVNFYSCNGDIPHTLGGRWRGAASFTPFAQQIFWKLAECINPLDKEMAGIHLYYANLTGFEDEHAKKYRQMGIAPWKPDGHLSLNYTVAAIHRRADWMVFVRGQRYPFLSTEAYATQAANTMGRYLNYGLISVVSGGNPPTELGSGLGWPKDEINCGWNFNYWPGTTARELPYAALRSHFEFQEFLTAETFAGGTSLDGNGVFGMKLQEDLPDAVDSTTIGPPRYWLGDAEYNRRVEESCYDTTFRARKSVFCFDNRIICLGSDIYSRDANHPVRTTLFQHQLRESDKTRLPFPEERQFEVGKGGFLLDRNGNGYYLAPGNDAVLFTRARRALPYHSHWNVAATNLHSRIVANEGDTELAVMDHGRAPENRGYEYCILVRADSQASAPAYEVLQRNTAAHIVHDPATHTTGYVLFERGDVENVKSVIRNVSKPSLVMTRETGSSLRVSVCDPEIPGDARAGVATPTTVELRLKGAWQPADTQPGVTVTTIGGDTELRVTCREAMPVVFELQSKGNRKL